MVSFLHWLQQYFVSILGGLTAFVVAVNSVVHGWRSDANTAAKQDHDWEKYIMEQVKADNKELRRQNKQQHEADQQEIKDKEAQHAADTELLRQTREQVGLVTRENSELKEKNRLLVAENTAYHEKYGDIDYAKFIEEN